MRFYVKDPALKGGGFTDTLSSTWSKVKQFVSESPLAQKVVKQGLAQGKRLAKDVAGKAVQMGLEKLGVPESAVGTATSLAGEAFDRLGDAAERIKHGLLSSVRPRRNARRGQYFGAIWQASTNRGEACQALVP